MSDKKSGEELEQTIRRCHSVLQAERDNREALRQSAEAWRQLGQHQFALEDYEAAIQSDPDDCYSYAGRAWIYATCPNERFRDGTKAVENALRARRKIGSVPLTHEPGKGVYVDTSIFTTLAAAYAAVGKFAKAGELVQRALFWTKEEKDKDALRPLAEAIGKEQPYREPTVSPELAAIGRRLAEQWA